MAKIRITKSKYASAQELEFAGHYAIYGNGLDALRHAKMFREDKLDYNGSKVRALLSKKAVSDEIRRIRKNVKDKSSYTVEKLLEELDELRELAKGDAKYADAIRATELKGKTIAAFVEKTENVNTNKNIEIDEGQLDADLKRLQNVFEVAPHETKH